MSEEKEKKNIIVKGSNDNETVIVIRKKHRPSINRVYTNPYFMYRHYYPYYGRAQLPYGYFPFGLSTRYLYPYIYPASYL
jgi:hypothetical protein